MNTIGDTLHRVRSVAFLFVAKCCATDHVYQLYRFPRKPIIMVLPLAEEILIIVFRMLFSSRVTLWMISGSY
jgi:hypothetical protein